MSDTTFARAEDLLPAPSAVTTGNGTFRLTGHITIQAPAQLRDAALWWSGVSAGSLGLTPRVVTPSDTEAAGLTLDLNPTIPAGGYTLIINDDGITIAASDEAGAHHALQTLRQLAGPAAYRAVPLTRERETVTFQHVEITDAPRTEWRGVLLDVARHFQPKSSVLRFIDQAAAHKLNRIQLHLTDDQGWRVEIDAYPKLTEIGSWRKATMRGTWRAGTRDQLPHGGYYSKDDLREIVAYARQRGITVVPEIDVPGHTQAAIAAYPEWGLDSSQDVEVHTDWGFSGHIIAPLPHVVDVFTTILDEVMEIFDGQWISLGGDEVVTEGWRADDRVVAHAADLGLPDVGDLQAWFLAELCNHVIANGRTPTVWDEGLRPGLPRETVIMAWRGTAIAARAVEAGYDAVLAPEQYLYLDHRAADGTQEPVPVGVVSTVEDVANFDPDPYVMMETRPEWVRDAAHLTSLPGPEDGVPGRVLGAQAQLWSEHLEDQRRLDYAAFPRLAAFSEVVWTGPDRRDTPDLLRRIAGPHDKRLEAMGIERRPAAGPHPWQQKPGVIGWYRDRERESSVTGWVGGAAYFDWHEIDRNNPPPELLKMSAEQPDVDDKG